MENYEQKYKEALEMAKVAALNGHQNLMEGIFPELRESDDEKIRKWLINLLGEMQYHHCDDEREMGDKALVWLEKQGQKSAWSEDYTERMGQIINYLTCQAKEEPTRRRTLLGWATLLKSIFRKGLPEIQIPCTEAARKGIHRIMDVLDWAADKGRISDSDCGDYMILLSAYLPQPKQEWSEEDEKILQWIITDIKRLTNDNKKANVIANKELDWLKSLKDRVGCEVNYTTIKEWSEEDERILYNVKAYVGYAAGHRGVRENEYKEAYEWLKFLKQRIGG